MEILLSSKIPFTQVLKQWALQYLWVYLAKVMPFFAEKVGRCQPGSRVSLAEGSLVIHSVIRAFPGKGSKGCQRALSHKLLDPLASCFFFLLPSGSPGNTGKHKACFISVDVLFSRFVLGQTSYPLTSTQVLLVDCWWWLRTVNEPFVGDTASSGRDFVAQNPNTSSSHPSHALPSPLVLPQHNWLPGGGQMSMMEQEGWQLAHPHHIQMPGLPRIQRAEASLSPPSV